MSIIETRLNVCFLFLPLFLCLFSLSLFVDYRKITKIRPGGYIFQRPFLRGLCTEGNLRFVLLCIRGKIPSTSPPGDLDQWRFKGFLRYDFWGFIFGGAHFRNYKVICWFFFLLKISVFSVYFCLPFCHWSVPNPDLKIWEGGPQYGPESPRGDGSPGPLPWIRHCWLLLF